jgi:N-acetylglucosamine-6-phosphate deacetylase
MLKAALKTGTSALLATSVTAPFQDISQFIESAKNVIDSPDSDAALLLGVHLEGPFINPEKLGAQPPYTVKPDLAIVRSWLDSGIVKVMTIAPEIDVDGQLLPLLLAHGVKVQIGHSNCSWHQAQLAINQGCGITHLYNAMGGVTHRDGGTATAALAYADFAEIITDGIHVEQAAFDIALRAIPNLYSVTDATAAAGMPDGNFMLGSLPVIKKGNQVQLPDGTLAGSCLTQTQSLALLRSWGLDWSTIAKLSSARPAAWINEAKLGKISQGAKANWIELQADTVVAIWVNGQQQGLTNSPL